MVVLRYFSAPGTEAHGDLFAISQLDKYEAGENVSSWVNKLSNNGVTPAYLLKRLARSTNPDVKMAVSDHRNTGLDVMFRLAVDVNADVRMAVAENHNISRDVLMLLLDDENPYVVDRARRTLARISIQDTDVLSWRTNRPVFAPLGRKARKAIA